MDLKSEFKDLNIDENLDKEVAAIKKKIPEDDLPEKVEDFSESDKIVKDLEDRLKQIKEQEGEEVVEEEDDEDEPTFYEKVQPFILPICLTIFAIVFAALFLYFFSKSRQQPSIPAIVNSGNVDPVYVPPEQPQVIVKEEPLKCDEETQILNETGDACIDKPKVEDPEPEPEPVVATFENGTTTVAHVRFSFDKFNYDNYPRGIYMLADQIFDGDYANFKVSPTNRAYANDYFFGVDRYMVSLIGSCQYVVDDAKILVKNMNLDESNKKFTGNVVKVIEASKPHVVCGQ